ncbi:hypothetical protein F5Y08DRAFT_343143 [Xylaria arbuscula]|nr:hypothetical protein F5Y08DRAFT_343143 [Xylaria arbuscula]
MASTEEPVSPIEPPTPGSEKSVACALEPITEAKDEGTASGNIQFHPDADLQVIINQTGVDPIVYLVCASALGCASLVWRTMLHSDDTSGKEARGQVKTLKLDGNPEALGLLFRIVHYDFSHVPKEPTLDQLFELGKSACKYQCTHLLYPWANEWTKSLSQFAGEDDCYSECHKALFAAWTFGDLRLYRDMVDALIVSTELDTNGKIVNIAGKPLEDMLMPCDLLEIITTVRASTIENILDSVKKPLNILSCGENGQENAYCKVGKDSHACETMMLGSIIPALTRARLFPIPEPGKFAGSIAQLKEKLDNIKTIPYVGREWAPHMSHDGCNLGFRESVTTCLTTMVVPISSNIMCWMSAQAKTCGIETTKELKEWQSKFENHSLESLGNSESAQPLKTPDIEEQDHAESEGTLEESRGASPDSCVAPL